jgi:hypothetical protein
VTAEVRLMFDADFPTLLIERPRAKQYLVLSVALTIGKKRSWLCGSQVARR